MFYPFKIFISILGLLLFAITPVFNAFAEYDIAPEPSSKLQKTKEVTGDKYMIVTADERASKAANEIIEQGGNAVDAAIAANLVLNVVEPQSSGIGGGGFLLFYDNKTKKIVSYDGRETAPGNAGKNLLLDKNGKALPFMKAVRHPKSIGVPGLLKMFEMAHRNHGKLDWKQLFKSAIETAQTGFLITPRLAEAIKYASKTVSNGDFEELYFDGKSPKKLGDVLINEKLAKTLELISKNGSSEFYEGSISNAIINKIIDKNGILTISDLENYKAKIRDLVCSDYRGKKICSMGLPSSGGITLLSTLGILENFKIDGKDKVKDIHLILESQALAFADRNKYLADSDFTKVPNVEKLLDKDYLNARSEMIVIDEVIKKPLRAGFLTDDYVQYNSSEYPSTTHISIVDKEGNAVSLTSSVEHSFGSGIMVEGFVLNNQLTDFSFYPEIDGVKIANSVQAGKRPRSSMTPVIILDNNDNIYAVLGSPGGSSIIPYVTKTITALVGWGLNLKDAVNFPHFMNKNADTFLEGGVSANIFKELYEKGHKVNLKTQSSGINAIIFDEMRGAYIGVADPRREGVALGG